MATTKKKPVTIAKTGAKKPATARKPATKRKPAAKKPVAKKLTPAEERDQKAKATVKELLKDSPITTPLTTTFSFLKRVIKNLKA